MSQGDHMCGKFDAGVSTAWQLFQCESVCTVGLARMEHKRWI